ncbi:MAG TPA: twin-arginine translocase subunit TatC [Elusimicrobia bacterium]|nr:twin-arginine translocase subunit TatC [Elusimicrobiota bacterium]
MTSSGRRLTLLEHLEELRRRLLVCLVCAAACACWVFPHSGAVIDRLAAPAGKLVFLSPAGAFLIRLKIAVFGGAFLALPILLYQAWSFVVEGLTDGERRPLLWVLPAAYLLFAAGAALALFVVVPAALRFLLDFGTPTLRPLMSVDEYLGFFFFMALAFGLLFQLPIALLFLHRIGVVTRAGLSGYRRHAYLLAFVIAAFLTPGPDVFSQFVLAVPTILLYEVSLLAMALSEPKAAAPAPLPL